MSSERKVRREQRRIMRMGLARLCKAGLPELTHTNDMLEKVYRSDDPAMVAIAGAFTDAALEHGLPGGLSSSFIAERAGGMATVEQVMATLLRMSGPDFWALDPYFYRVGRQDERLSTQEAYAATCEGGEAFNDLRWTFMPLASFAYCIGFMVGATRQREALGASVVMAPGMGEA